MKRRVLFCLAACVVLACAGCSSLAKEHQEARNLAILDIDFKTLRDGTFTGFYEGGMRGWRENECTATVSGKKVVDIRLVYSKEDRPEEFFTDLYGRVLAKQSLQVDVVGGATLTSKAHLKALENALLKGRE